MELVQYHVNERIASLTLNRPDKRNALNDEMVEALADAFARAAADDEVKVIILKAAGNVFCAGADLAYLQQLQQNSYEENLVDSERLAALFNQIYRMEKVVIAQIGGHAIAGGCGLATICDIAFSVPSAKFGYTEVKIGFIPAIVSLFLIRKTGETRAKELLLSGRLIDAETARQYNLINFLVAEEALEAQVTEYARMLCDTASGQSLALTKRLFTRLPELSLANGLQYAAEMNAEARGSDDCQRGIAAFLRKEEIKW
jgi:methylglutaconyl-CoA hydratase